MILADLKGRSRRERQVLKEATPETVRKLDNVTIDRLAERRGNKEPLLAPEHLDAWLEIHDAWRALSRGLGMRLMRFDERTDAGKVELSDRHQRLIERYSAWRERLRVIHLHEAGEIIVGTVEGHSLRDMVPDDREESWQRAFERIKNRLRDGLEEYCQMNGMC